MLDARGKHKQNNNGNVFVVTPAQRRAYPQAYVAWNQIRRYTSAHRMRDRGLRTMDPSWYSFETFAQWFAGHFHDNCVLSTDVFVIGSRHYGPATCAYIPKWLQCTLTTLLSFNGYTWNKSCKAYRCLLKGQWFVGVGLYHTEAMAAYKTKKAKARHLRKLAVEAYDQDMIDEEVYAALVQQSRDLLSACSLSKQDLQSLQSAEYAAYVNSCKLVCGVGFNDLMDRIPTQKLESYRAWQRMLKRCYDRKYYSLNTTYKDCTVDARWHVFSAFKEWFDRNYIDGYQLDKDIMVPGNKVYGPDTCCFVPAWINTLILTSNEKQKSKYGTGVIRKRSGEYMVAMSMFGKRTRLRDTYHSAKEATRAYWKTKRQHIRLVAMEAYEQGYVNEEVYAALIRLTRSTLFNPQEA